MNPDLKKRFLDIWSEYFPGTELPLAYYYTNEKGRGESPASRQGFHCIVCALSEARNGKTLAFTSKNLACGGALRYLGYSQKLRPNFEYFLSCGIPGKLEGERYKKSPELVRGILQRQPSFQAPGKFIVFTRWDMLEDTDEPLAVVFFASPDVLSGLFTLANFDEPEPDGVIAPFGSGCSSLVYHPFHESLSDHPRAVLGMFDVSARPCVGKNTLTLAIPWTKFMAMVNNAGESFLLTESWNKVRERISRNS
jgi:hypothetical protein